MGKGAFSTPCILEFEVQGFLWHYVLDLPQEPLKVKLLSLPGGPGELLSGLCRVFLQANSD